MHAEDLAGATVSAPVLLMVGSLAGCTRKEAVSYARALAEQYVGVAAEGSFAVYRDKPHGRYAYEVQEGGSGVSVLESVLAKLDEAGQPVTISLANRRTVTVGDNNGELFSLIDQPGSAQDATTAAITRFAGKSRLTPLIRKDRRLLAAAFACVGVGLLVLTASLAMGAIGKTYILDKSVTPAVITRLASDARSNDVIGEFIKAKHAATSKGKRIAKFQKKDGTWSWEFFQ